MKLRAFLNEKHTKEQQSLAKAIYHIFGVKVVNIFIYELAFRHKSVASEVKSGCNDSYERLEFLGDAILGAVISEFLFKKFPFKSEGFLTNLRSKIVCGKFLSKISQKLGLNKLIHFQNNANNKFVTSVFGDVLEAVIGALFIDKGFETTRKIIIERIIKLHVDIELLVDTETNFKSRLIEWAQKEKAELCFSMKNEKTVNGQKQYTVEVIIDSKVICEAIHNTIKECEQLAAERSIVLLKERGLYDIPDKNL